MAVSAGWGLMPWLCWEAGNPLNHLYLAACGMAVVAGIVVSRGSNAGMYLAGLMPISAMITLRFLFGESYADWIHRHPPRRWWRRSSGIPARPLVARMEEDSRLRFKVEDLARELEETRDDALRKRFEAETANASKDRLPRQYEP